MLTKDFALDLGLNYAQIYPWLMNLQKGWMQGLYTGPIAFFMQMLEKNGNNSRTGYKKHENGKRIVDPTTGNYMYENNMNWFSFT